jgi:hypothetical protein
MPTVRDIIEQGKNQKEAVSLAGNVNFVHYDGSGNILGVYDGHNVVVLTGLQNMVGLLLTDQSGVDMDYIAIGTSNTAAATTDTALAGEDSRSAGSGTVTSTTLSNDTAQLQVTFAITGADRAVQESGVFSSSSAGTMLCRKTFSDINVSTGDSLQVTWKVKFA